MISVYHSEKVGIVDEVDVKLGQMLFNKYNRLPEGLARDNTKFCIMEIHGVDFFQASATL